MCEGGLKGRGLKPFFSGRLLARLKPCPTKISLPLFRGHCVARQDQMETDRLEACPTVAPAFLFRRALS